MRFTIEKHAVVADPLYPVVAIASPKPPGNVIFCKKTADIASKFNISDGYPDQDPMHAEGQTYREWTFSIHDVGSAYLADITWCLWMCLSSWVCY